MCTINLNTEEQGYASEVQEMEQGEHVMAVDCIETIMSHLVKHKKNMKDAKLAEHRLMILKGMLRAHYDCLGKP
ncbi:MAG: hypothetical protein ABJG41_19350 [Cyclobacteriaceae bacterium]